jgi:hypothetical protein
MYAWLARATSDGVREQLVVGGLRSQRNFVQYVLVVYARVTVCGILALLLFTNAM